MTATEQHPAASATSEETVGSRAGTQRIYVYTVIGKDRTPWTRTEGSTEVAGAGLFKVGQTTKPTARDRIKQQLGTAYPDLTGVSILVDEPAIRLDGSQFTDHDVHHALKAAGIQRD